MGWPDLTEFDFRPRLTSNPLHELQYNVKVSSISVVQKHCLQICGTFTRRDHTNTWSCLVTSSSAMEALGSPSILRAPMGGDHAFRIPKTSVCRWQVQRQYTIIRLPVSKFFKIITWKEHKVYVLSKNLHLLLLDSHRMLSLLNLYK